MKKLLCFLLALAMLFTIASCGSGGAVSSSHPAPELSELPEEPEEPAVSAVTSEPEQPEEPSPVFVNPLTGEPTETDISAYRPYAIMLNNIKQALPQSSNAKADLYYELPEEGGITRVMAVYQDLTGAGKIGSIRSTRPYFAQIAYSLDSILVHAGASKEGNATLKELGVQNVNSLGKGTSVFYRDQARLDAGKALEHTLYADSDDIQEWVANSSGYPTEHDDAFLSKPFHTFVEDGTPANGSAANVVTVPFSGYKTGVFNYDAEKGVYLVEEYGEPYIDEQTGEQIAVTNVIVIQTSISLMKDTTQGRLDIGLLGSGEGYYACGGKYIPILWSKESHSDFFTFTTTDGEELSLGIGKTYVNIVSSSQKITFE